MEIKTNHGIKLTGFFRGQVKKHCSDGKCKIFIPGVYPDECLENFNLIPDAEQAAPLFGGVNNGNGMFSYPNIDSIVWCFFENGDHNRPVYFASTLGGELAINTIDQGFKKVRTNVCDEDENGNDTTETGADAQQHCIVCQSSVGASEIMIRESGQIEIKTKSDEGYSTINIDGSGTITISTSDSIQVDSPSVKISGNQQIELNSQMVKIRASDQLYIDSPMFTCRSKTAVNVKSPSIMMDASEGKFMASSQNHSPLYLV